MLKKTNIISGKIYRNWLEDFPQHILAEKNKSYELYINDGLSLKLKFNFNQNATKITLPFLPVSSDIDCIIDWGDNTDKSHIFKYNDENASHIYETSGIYIVSVDGKFNGFNNKKFQEGVAAAPLESWENLIEIINWGISDDPLNFNYAFYNAQRLSGLPDNYFSTAVESASHCFDSCTSLNILPDKFEFVSNINDISYMFNNCTSLDINDNKLLSLPKNLCSSGAVGLFQNCYSLTKIPRNLFNNNPVNLNSFDLVFKNCSSLILSNETFIPTENIISFCETFSNCKSLSALNDNFNIGNDTTNIFGMFENCSSLIYLPTGFIFPSSLKNLQNFCINCISLTEIYNTCWPVDFFDIESEINIASAFFNCINITGTVPQYKLWKSEVNWVPETPSVTTLNLSNAPNTFYECKKLDNYRFIPIHWRWFRRTIQWI